MLYILVVAAALVCALQAITTARMLVSAIWLAAASALVALLMYLLGAAEVAVIELSVGAGLVTVLFVFAINITGDEELDRKSLIPAPVAWVVVLVPIVILGFLNLPKLNLPWLDIQGASFSDTLWHERSPDLFLQVLLIFSGVLGILGLLSENKPSPHEEQ